MFDFQGGAYLTQNFVAGAKFSNEYMVKFFLQCAVVEDHLAISVSLQNGSPKSLLYIYLKLFYRQILLESISTPKSTMKSKQNFHSQCIAIQILRYHSKMVKKSTLDQMPIFKKFMFEDKPRI